MARILIADDDLDFTEQMTLVLQNAGHLVRVCRNGKEAVACLSTFPADLVILDMRMSYTLDGLDALRQIRMGTAKPGPRVLVVSSLDGEADGILRDRASELGVAGWLRKPAEPEQILRWANGD